MPAEVTRDTVIDVLRRHGVAVYPCEPGSDTLVLVKSDAIEAQLLPAVAGRKLLHYLARKFGVPIHHFFNPLEAPRLPDDHVQ